MKLGSGSGSGFAMCSFGRRNWSETVVSSLLPGQPCLSLFSRRGCQTGVLMEDVCISKSANCDCYEDNVGRAGGSDLTMDFVGSFPATWDANASTLSKLPIQRTIGDTFLHLRDALCDIEAKITEGANHENLEPGEEARTRTGEARTIGDTYRSTEGYRLPLSPR